MRADIEKDRLDILGDDVIPFMQHRRCTRHAHECGNAARRNAELDQRMDAALFTQLDGVAQHIVHDLDRAEELLHLDDVLCGRDRMQLVKRIGVTLRRDDLHLILDRGIADRERDHEAVELALRERLRAGEAEGILRRDADERRRERVRLAVHRDGALLHDLEQRGLRFRRSAVDLVGEQQLTVRRALTVFEFARPAVPHGETGDVGRQRVGRKLDAARRETEHARERDRERRLADTRAVLEQNVTACVNRHQDLLDDLILADKRAVYLGNNLF